MADLPDIDEIKANQAIGEEYEHPEPHSSEGGCSNLGGMPDELYFGDVDDDPEDEDE